MNEHKHKHYKQHKIFYDNLFFQLTMKGFLRRGTVESDEFDDESDIVISVDNSAFILSIRKFSNSFSKLLSSLIFLTLNQNDMEISVQIANYYRNDFLYPGNNLNVSFHANRDKPSTEFERSISMKQFSRQ